MSVRVFEVQRHPIRVFFKALGTQGWRKMALRRRAVKSIVSDGSRGLLLIQRKALASLTAKPYLISEGHRWPEFKCFKGSSPP